MTIETKPLSEITQQAIGILTREIGVANTVRFINQFTTGFGNYTEERKELFGHMSLDDIISEMETARRGG